MESFGSLYFFCFIGNYFEICYYIKTHRGIYCGGNMDVTYAPCIDGEFYKAGFLLRELIVRQNLYRTYIIRKINHNIVE